MKRVIGSVLVLLALGIYLLRYVPEKFSVVPFFAMGTLVQVTVPASKVKLVPEIEKIMNKYEKKIKLGAAKLAASDSYIEIDDTMYYLLKRGIKYSNIFPKFSIKTATVSSLYGFPSGPYVMPDEETLKNAVETMKNGNILVKEEGGKFFACTDVGVTIDTGAYAKGFIVDVAAKFLETQGIRNYIINAGGDIYTKGRKGDVRWTFGITDPDNTANYVDVIYPENKALATSGNYERSFEYEGKIINHIFDAETGESSNNYKSVSVIANDAETADAYATMLYLSSVDEIENVCKSIEISVMLILKDGNILKICNWDKYNK